MERFTTTTESRNADKALFASRVPLTMPVEGDTGAPRAHDHDRAQRRRVGEGQGAGPRHGVGALAAREDPSPRGGASRLTGQAEAGGVAAPASGMRATPPHRVTLQRRGDTIKAHGIEIHSRYSNGG
jgi:hypothetical protein